MTALGGGGILRCAQNNGWRCGAGFDAEKTPVFPVRTGTQRTRETCLRQAGWRSQQRRSKGNRESADLKVGHYRQRAKQRAKQSKQSKAKQRAKRRGPPRSAGLPRQAGATKAENCLVGFGFAKLDAVALGINGPCETAVGFVYDLVADDHAFFPQLRQ